MWNFGDSSYSTDKNPIHHYKKPGKFEVVLLADSFVIKKEIIIEVGFEQLARKRNWKALFLTLYNGNSKLHVNIDTSFALFMPNIDTIILPAEQRLNIPQQIFSKHHYADGILHYTCNDTAFGYIDYYVEKDSISILRRYDEWRILLGHHVRYNTK